MTYAPGDTPYKSVGGACHKIWRTSLEGTRILLYGRVPNSFPPLRGTDSTTTNYITGTANFNSTEITFEHILLKDFLKVLEMLIKHIISGSSH